MTLGVYRIFNTVTGEFYIGSSSDCKRRFAEHRSMLKTRSTPNKAFQTSWDQHGAGAFVLDILHVCETREEAFDIEEDILGLCKGMPALLNIATEDARSSFRDSAVKTLSRAAMNESEHYKAVHRRVCQERNVDPETIAKMKAGRGEAWKAARALTTAILRSPEVVAKNREVLRNSVAQKAAAQAQCQRFHADPVWVAKNLLATSKKVIGTSVKDGSTITFPSQSAAARAVGVWPANISECCRHPTKTCKGYRWCIDSRSE